MEVQADSRKILRISFALCTTVLLCYEWKLKDSFVGGLWLETIIFLWKARNQVAQNTVQLCLQEKVNVSSEFQRRDLETHGNLQGTFERNHHNTVLWTCKQAKRTNSLGSKPLLNKNISFLWRKARYKEKPIVTKFENNRRDSSSAAKCWWIISWLILIWFGYCFFTCSLILELKLLAGIFSNFRRCFCKWAVENMSRCFIRASCNNKRHPREGSLCGSWFARSYFLLWHSFLVSFFRWVWTTDKELSQGSGSDREPALAANGSLPAKWWKRSP